MLKIAIVQLMIWTVATAATAQCNGVGDIIFVVAAYPDLGKVAFQQEKDFFADVSRSLPIGDNKFRVGAVRYSNKAVASFHLKLYKKNELLAKRLQRLVFLAKAPRILPAQGLNLLTKLSMFEPKRGGRVLASRVVVLLLDGRAENLEPTITEANALKKQGVQVVVVGVGSVPLDTLKRIASSNSNVFSAKSYADLVNLRQQLSQRICRIPQEEIDKPVEKCNALVDFVFALDTSGSIGLPNFQKELLFATDIVKTFEVGANSARFGALLFSTNVKPVFNLNKFSTQSDVIQALQAAPYLAGGTDTAKALAYIREQQLFSVGNGGRQNAKDVVIVVTDGKSNNVKNTVKMADKLKATGVTVLAVGIGQANQQELRSIASSPDLVYTAQSFDQLEEIKRVVSRGACEASQPDIPDNNVVGPTEVYPTGVPIDETENNGGNNVVTTAKPLPATTTPKPCPALADIVFVIDSSGSLGPDNYDKEQQFAIDISKRFPIGPTGARFGCVIFSSTAQIMFDLSDDLDRAALEEALDLLPYLNTTTHTFKAFDLLFEADIFSADNGGRNNAAKIIIFLTDGFSSNTTKTAEAAQRLKDQGVSIISVGIGQYSLAELRAVADSDRNVFTATSFQAIEKITQEVATRACQVPSEGIKYQVSESYEK